MSGFNWLWFIPVSFVFRKLVALLNTHDLDIIGHLGINKFQSAKYHPRELFNFMTELML